MKIIAITTTLLLAAGQAAFANLSSQLIPGQGNLYYEIGGGDITPLPYDSGTNIRLNVGGNASLGLNCGAFNPETSIMNSLNGVGHSFGKMAADVKNNLTGMIIGEAGYEMAKAMPNVYKFMRDGFSLGQDGFSLSTKSCQTMLSEVDQGKNPGKDWMNAAMGQDWQYHMSLASSQAAKEGLLGSNSNDITQAQSTIDQDAGKSGVQWVQGISKKGQTFAGGKFQPTIKLTSDTVIAGYNVLLGNNRSYDDMTTPMQISVNQGITGIFASPIDAGKWAEYVIGENTITTYSGGSKMATPGKGLLHYIESQTQQIKPILARLVEEQTTQNINLKELQKLNSPKITISPGVISAIQKINDPTLQAIWVSRIAQGIAANRVINKAELVRQFLLVGSQVPAISANSAAQKGIESDMQHLNMFINSVRQGPENTRTFLSGSISDLLHAVHNQEVSNASIQASSSLGPLMENGAISRGKES